MVRMHRFFMFLALIAPLLFSMPFTYASWQPEISIGLMNGQTSVTLLGHYGALSVYTSLEEKSFLTVPKEKSLLIEVRNGTFLINGKEKKMERLIVEVSDRGVIQVNGASYRGYITLFLKNGVTVVNNVPVEDYLYGVVPKEMPASWNMEALRAQSVAARTFALKNRGRHRAEGYDLCNTAECQVYEGMGAETKASTEAVDSTRGEVLFYQGTISDALFHTDSGGMTESSENVWGSRVPYLRSVPEVQVKTLPWNRSISLARFVQKIETAEKKIGRLKDIKLSPLQIGKGREDRSISGRVLTMRVIGDKGNIILTGNKIRALFALPSTLFSVRILKSNVEFSGYGSGHGLGMSQWGAKAFAERGKNYKDILRYYYTGVSVEKLY